MRRRGARRFSLKALFPSDLFGRAFLILVLPMLLSPLFITHIFYDRHWGSVARNMANSVVGDIAWLSDTYTEESRHASHAAALKKTVALGTQLNIAVTYEPLGETPFESGKGKRQFAELYKGLTQRLGLPVAIRFDDTTNQVVVRVATDHGILHFSMNRKMLVSPTTTIFILWMIGSSLVLTTIATLFLRNQVRPIVRLAQVAEQLGLGQDVTDFKPRGASEVRRAGGAFLVMAERLRRHVQNRTEMLAGISHDLRTPLTRMKLELELANIPAATRAALGADIDEMGKMIDEYLDFARGDAGELPEPVDIHQLLGDIVADYRRSARNVTYAEGAPVTLMLRPQAMRRAITNLIDNALRYGDNQAALTLEQSTTFVRVKITDVGHGIPDSEHETVFKPFTRLEPSRNITTGGVGLGLSIARAVAQGHGGDVTLENQRDATGAVSGLEVTLRLPRALQQLGT
jgi:two-component system osmolarity sensor histidine kinase EnvZ